MQLKDVVNALRREIISALENGSALPGGIHLEAERVTATLSFGIEGNPPTFEVYPPGENKQTSPHSITIEFNIASDSAALKTETKIVARSVAVQPMQSKLEGREAAVIKEQLSIVFGSPGFDSAARATVFCEALEELSEEDAVALVSALRGEIGKPEGPAKRALALLQRVCQSGPAGLGKGKAVLVDVFQKYSVSSVVKLVATVWKSQQDWIK